MCVRAQDGGGTEGEGEAVSPLSRESDPGIMTELKAHT